MNNVSELLAQLRDIHEPAPPGIWPPAPGWWLLGLLLIVSLTLAAKWLRGKYLASRPRKNAVAELQKIMSGQSTNPLAELSVLLKKAALHRYGREQVAGLTGQDWLTFLDRTTGGDEFSNGPGRHFLQSPYRQPARVDTVTLNQLGDLVRKWVNINLRA